MGAKSQIIMKVDAPPEDKNITPQGNHHPNTTTSISHLPFVPDNIENNVDKMDSTPSSVKPKLPSSSFNNSFALRSSILGQPKLSTGFVLRPSALGAKVENKTEGKSHTFALNPNRLNPFGSPDTGDGVSNCAPKKDNSNGSEETDTPKFVPLGVSNSEAGKQSTSANSLTTPNFVFGQNLHERILAENENAAEANNSQAGPSTSHTNANGTSELLFSSAVKSSTPTDSNKEVKTLTESAREYEESRANKRKYEEVTVVTGEEDEKNIMQINCKLFAFDKATGNWQERGRGTLRLNDKEVSNDDETHVQSRLVIRTTGSLRVVLNTKVKKYTHLTIFSFVLSLKISFSCNVIFKLMLLLWFLYQTEVLLSVEIS